MDVDWMMDGCVKFPIGGLISGILGVKGVWDSSTQNVLGMHRMRYLSCCTWTTTRLDYSVRPTNPMCFDLLFCGTGMIWTRGAPPIKGCAAASRSAQDNCPMGVQASQDGRLSHPPSPAVGVGRGEGGGGNGGGTAAGSPQAISVREGGAHANCRGGRRATTAATRRRGDDGGDGGRHDRLITVYYADY